MCGYTVKLMEVSAAMNPENHLKSHILDILQAQETELSEYELIKALEKKTKSNSLLSGQLVGLALFQQHFLVMNALYQLRAELRLKEEELLISPVHIQKVSGTCFEYNNEGENTLSAHDPLASYYLDWENFYGTEEEDVECMLESFWDLLMKDAHREEALETLGLDSTATKQEIRKAYLRLASVKHPDKGGQESHFKEIQQAYELLISRRHGAVRVS